MRRGTDKPSHGMPLFCFVMRDYYPTAGEIVLLPYERIISRPSREADAYTEQALSELVLSIQNNGLLEPIRVSAVDEQYYRIASGERRFRASLMAGLTTLPCIVMEESSETVPYALIDDLQHRQMHYFEQAALIQRLLHEEGVSLPRLAELLCVPVITLSQKLQLLVLSEELRGVIRGNALSEDYARLLLTAEEGKRRDVLYKILAEDLSLTEAKAYIRQQTEKKKRSNLMIFKDLNVFVNTVEHAVETMNRSGIASSVDRTETEEQITYTVIIRKNG